MFFGNGYYLAVAKAIGGKTPYSGKVKPEYANVQRPAAWTAQLDQAAKDKVAADARAKADAAAKLPPPPPTTVDGGGIYAYMAAKGNPCYDIGVKAGLIVPAK